MSMQSSSIRRGLGGSKVDLSGSCASMVFVGPPVPRPVLRGALLVTLLTAIAIAGCSGKGAPPKDDLAAAEGMTIIGLVQNETFAPIPGAQVSLRLTGHVATTDSGGLFAFNDLPLSPYLVDVAAAGFENATLNAEPLHNVSLSFVLVRRPRWSRSPCNCTTKEASTAPSR